MSLQDYPRNELSPLPWCIDRVGEIVSSETSVDVATSKMAMTPSATLADVFPLSHAKPPCNQLSIPVNLIPHAQNKISLPSNEMLLQSNNASPSQNEAFVDGIVAYPQVTETTQGPDTTVGEDLLKRVNALKNIHTTFI